MSIVSEEFEGDESQALLPTYGEAVNQITNRSVASVLAQLTPGIAGNGEFYSQIPEEEVISFFFQSHPGMDDMHQQWKGRMAVKCRDASLLMREGFAWTAENLIREEGYIEFNEGFTSRYWFLQDLQQPPRWCARLRVDSQFDNVLFGIRLENWTINMISSVIACGLLNKIIYRFDNSLPQCCFSIYDDMPLEGWWPWPKEDLQVTENA
ncbi:hypothetical protein M426DRAFT_28717 [Hypoxylon sp. CI-4A]|nr:hypothetical protein M426DRAFT_28717 [Hypoxylon sp. CI-4A]